MTTPEPPIPSSLIDYLKKHIDIPVADEFQRGWNRAMQCCLSFVCEQATQPGTDSPDRYSTGIKQVSAIPVEPVAPHPTHEMRSSDASTFDQICDKCGHTDQVPGGLGKLADPCPASASSEIPDAAFDAAFKAYNDAADEHDGRYCTAGLLEIALEAAAAYLRTTEPVSGERGAENRTAAQESGAARTSRNGESIACEETDRTAARPKEQPDDKRKRCYADIAEEYQYAQSNLEDRMLDLGMTDWGSVWTDPYDNSIEFGKVDADNRLSKEAQQYLSDEGFSRCWLNHKDGMETYYALDGNEGSRRQSPPHRLATLSEPVRESGCRKCDLEMERVKACEHIAEGDMEGNDWRVLRNICPSTMAVADLRDKYEIMRDVLQMLSKRPIGTWYEGTDPVGGKSGYYAGWGDAEFAILKALEGEHWRRGSDADV